MAEGTAAGRKRVVPVADGHGHEGFEVPFDDPAGRPVDEQLLGEFIGAAFDGCASCQDALLTLIVESPPTAARLVELACITAETSLGGVPSSLTDPDAPGMASQEFRQLARIGADGNNDRLFAACAEMTPVQRRAAVNTAADILIGHLAGS